MHIHPFCKKLCFLLRAECLRLRAFYINNFQNRVIDDPKGSAPLLFKTLTSALAKRAKVPTSF